LLSNASFIWSKVAFCPGGVSSLTTLAPWPSISCDSLLLNSPFTGIMILSPFLTRLMTLASTAPVPDADNATISFCVSNTCWVFSTTSREYLNKIYMSS